MIRSDQETLEAIKGHLRGLRDRLHLTGSTAQDIRAGEEEALNALPKLQGTKTRQVTAGGCPAEWVWVGADAEDIPGGAGVSGSRSAEQEVQPHPMVLYFHGGSFIAGSTRTHRDLAARISRASGVRVLVFDYRLAPEHLYPAANEDALAVYRWLLGQGFASQEIVFGGDSVGGTLALMTLLSLRDAGDPLPAGAFLLSPHTDLIYLDSETYVTHAELDPTGSLHGSRMCAEYYMGGSGTRPAILSPLHKELNGLPSLLVQVGDQEVLLGECRRFVERACGAGVTAELQEWEGMWCVFQQLAGILPEGQEAIVRVGEYIQRRLAGKVKG